MREEGERGQGEWDSVKKRRWKEGREGGRKAEREGERVECREGGGRNGGVPTANSMHCKQYARTCACTMYMYI